LQTNTDLLDKVNKDAQVQADGVIDELTKKWIEAGN
jgi:hypothetical protein